MSTRKPGRSVKVSIPDREWIGCGTGGLTSRETYGLNREGK